MLFKQCFAPCSWQQYLHLNSLLLYHPSSTLDVYYIDFHDCVQSCRVKHLVKNMKNPGPSGGSPHEIAISHTFFSRSEGNIIFFYIIKIMQLCDFFKIKRHVPDYSNTLSCHYLQYATWQKIPQIKKSNSNHNTMYCVNTLNIEFHIAWLPIYYY